MDLIEMFFELIHVGGNVQAFGAEEGNFGLDELGDIFVGIVLKGIFLNRGGLTVLLKIPFL